MGVAFIGYTDKVYRYSAGNDILFEQLFTIMPVKELEIISGLTYQRSGNLPQTNFLDSPFNTRNYRSFSNSVSYSDSVSGSFGINPMRSNNFSFFTQSYYSLRSFRFMGGVRLDKNTVYGVSFSPRLAGLYILNPRTSFRSSIGYAYKAPPSSMSWQSLAYKAGINLDSLVYLSIPNPDLIPEKYMSVEFGLIKKYRSRVTMNISFYYNSIKNLILNKYRRLNELNLPLAIINPDTASVLTRVNEPDAVSRLYGLQANIKINDLVKSINMDAEVNLTFAKSTESDPNIFDIAGSFLSDFKLTPKHFGQMKISMEPAKNLYIQVSSIWESAWLRLIIPFREIYNEIISDVDGFYSMDLVADYKIGNNLSTFIKISNVFNEKYGGPVFSGMNTPLPYSPQTGFGIQIGLTYKLN
jgi:outer membrane receptor for ferrienterochelin and colicin